MLVLHAHPVCPNTPGVRLTECVKIPIKRFSIYNYYLKRKFPLLNNNIKLINKKTFIVIILFSIMKLELSIHLHTET